MPYSVRIDPHVQKEMAPIPAKDRASILAIIKSLAQDPRPAGCIPIKGPEKYMYRVRVGDYRVIYGLQDEEQKVIVARVTRRREDTYRGLS